MKKVKLFLSIIALCILHTALPAATRVTEATLPATRASSEILSRDRAGITSRAATTRNAAPAAVSIRPQKMPIVSRSAVTAAARTAAPIANTARAAANVSRSATTARATALYTDLSKLGGTYAACRDTYTTCMDQFCGYADETMRRCYCSDTYTAYNDRKATLDSAKTILQGFRDTNLSAVKLSAAESSAMSMATAGENAMATDTSAAAATLSEISDLLSGKKKAPVAAPLQSSVLDLNFDFEALWSGTSAENDIFAAGAANEFASLSGRKLYSEVSRQCAEMALNSCTNQSNLSMAQSAYSILITQDCNAVGKTLDAAATQIEQSVRAEYKNLRRARLEEYQEHNSASVNECIAKVKTAIQNDSACGANYRRCLDFTGQYINQTTGEPIYSPSLFQLADQIQLENPNAAKNTEFMAGLEQYKNRAAAALETCRDDSTAVWNAFKQQALIEIAQAQDARLQQVKDSCVATMKECYDTQSNALKSFDDTTAQMSGAVAARASSQMCADKVAACANMYADPNNAGCVRANASTLRNTSNAANTCGLQSLLAFVSTVDDVRVAEGCEQALNNQMATTCAPMASDTTHKWPWGCRGSTPAGLRSMLTSSAATYCAGIDATDIIEKITASVMSNMDWQLSQACYASIGQWVTDISVLAGVTYTRNTAFYGSVSGGNQNDEWGGICIENSGAVQCKLQDEITGGAGHAVWNNTSQTCEYDDEWYRQKCEGWLDGQWNSTSNVCVYKRP